MRNNTLGESVRFDYLNEADSAMSVHPNIVSRLFHRGRGPGDERAWERGCVHPSGRQYGRKAISDDIITKRACPISTVPVPHCTKGNEVAKGDKMKLIDRGREGPIVSFYPIYSITKVQLS